MLPPSHHLPLLWYPSYLCLFKFLLSNHLIFASWIKCSSHSPNWHLFGLFRNQPLHYFLVRSGNALYNVLYYPTKCSARSLTGIIRGAFGEHTIHNLCSPLHFCSVNREPNREVNHEPILHEHISYVPPFPHLFNHLHVYQF